MARSDPLAAAFAEAAAAPVDRCTVCLGPTPGRAVAAPVVTDATHLARCDACGRAVDSNGRCLVRLDGRGGREFSELIVVQGHGRRTA